MILNIGPGPILILNNNKIEVSRLVVTCEWPVNGFRVVVARLQMGLPHNCVFLSFFLSFFRGIEKASASCVVESLEWSGD